MAGQECRWCGRARKSALPSAPGNDRTDWLGRGEQIPRMAACWHRRPSSPKLTCWHIYPYPTAADATGEVKNGTGQREMGVAATTGRRHPSSPTKKCGRSAPLPWQKVRLEKVTIGLDDGRRSHLRPRLGTGAAAVAAPAQASALSAAVEGARSGAQYKQDVALALGHHSVVSSP